jgi:putative lipoic acid-binding regulatory protein
VEDGVDKPQRYEDVLDFPCDFTFRIVANADESVRTACEVVIISILSQAPLGVAVKPSSKGTYAVYRISTRVTNADQIRAIYDALADIEGVRTLL